MRIVTPILVALALIVSTGAYAQTDGSLRGYARDESGAILPGVTVTAESEALMAPSVVVTDGTGQYRILNLPPGDYALSFEMPGFAIYRQEGIVLRAGANYSVDATLTISSVQETITVTAETPMLEIASPSNVLNIEGDFQRHMPIQANRNWSDFLELTPGINARPFDDGSGRMVYFGHGSEHFHHAIQLEGMKAENYQDAQVTYVAMGADMIDDVQVKSGGVQASEPLATGMVINVVTKSGGNRFAGSVGWAYQDIDWSSDNSPEPGAGNVAGNPTKQKVNQLDLSFGGPIMQDKIWFFAAFRRARNENGISRTGREATTLQAYDPGFESFNNTYSSNQPYVKVTAQVNPNHELNGYWQSDRDTVTANREYNWEPIFLSSHGGDLFGGKLTSVWGTDTTSQITMNYNNKSGNDQSTLDNAPGSGPRVRIYEDSRISGGRRVGSGFILEGGNDNAMSIMPASIKLFRGDVTHYKEGWGGSHELQTGIYLAFNRRDSLTNYRNDGYTYEYQVLVDENDPGGGTIPFARRYRDPITVPTLAARDRDIGVYFQDAWKPNPRLTLNLGLRLDWVNRRDEIFNFTRMDNALALGPRVGFSYMLTEDARNVIRGSFVRVHEQVGGRDFATSTGPSSTSSSLWIYDNNLDGIFGDAERFTPQTNASVAEAEFDPDLHQPWVDEAIVGFRKQFPSQLALDVAYVYRRFNHRYAQWDVNGMYPGQEGCPGPAFCGFGRVDPDRGRILEMTNNDYDRQILHLFEVTATQRLPGRVQFMAGLTRQWHHMEGTWNPTDPARFIQPDAYPNNRLIYPTRGFRDDNSLDLGTTSTYGPMWRKYSIRLGGTWNAPYGIILAASYTQLAGPWSGPLLLQLSATDPDVTRFGPGTVVSETGSEQTNPLSTITRFVGPTRSDGQAKKGDVKSFGLKIAKLIGLGGTRELEVAANIFNLPNTSGHHQYTYNGANQTWNSNYLQERSLQSPRALQLTFVFRY